MQAGFSIMLLFSCLLVQTGVIISNEHLSSKKDITTAIKAKADTCDSHKEVKIIDNHIYMVVNGVQHPIIVLKNRRSFHRHFEYFYSLGLNPKITEYIVEEDSNAIILECSDKYYY